LKDAKKIGKIGLDLYFFTASEPAEITEKNLTPFSVISAGSVVLNLLIKKRVCYPFLIVFEPGHF
jgi:hypothetical protein